MKTVTLVAIISILSLIAVTALLYGVFQESKRLKASTEVQLACAKAFWSIFLFDWFYPPALLAIHYLSKNGK